VVRIAISQAAFEAIARTLPLGGVGCADWQAKAEEWLRKTTAPLIDGLGERSWSTRRPS
jgi:hypothetical protein